MSVAAVPKLEEHIAANDSEAADVQDVAQQGPNRAVISNPNYG
jgi:hypothetical protein